MALKISIHFADVLMCRNYSHCQREANSNIEWERSLFQMHEKASASFAEAFENGKFKELVVDRYFRGPIGLERSFVKELTYSGGNDVGLLHAFPDRVRFDIAIEFVGDDHCHADFPWRLVVTAESLSGDFFRHICTP